MAQFQLTYPVTEKVMKELSTRPNLASSPQCRKLVAGDRSPLEIVRVLLNLNLEHLQRLVDLLERLYQQAGEIRKRVLQQTDPFQQEGALAELLVFAHLVDRFDGSVTPVPTGARVGHDISVDWSDRDVRLEIYSPADVVGFQRFRRLLDQVFKYADVPPGFHVSIDVQGRDGAVALDFPDESTVLPWYRGFAEEVAEWLQTANEGDSREWQGPAGLVSITAKLEDVSDVMSDRQIAWSGPFQASDSMTLFCDLDGRAIAKLSWGQKVKAKLERRQCGDRESGTLRVFVLDFGGLDASEWTFLNDPVCAAHIDAAIRAMVDEDDLPYDCVIPADLRLECGFGQAVILDESRREEIEAFIHEAGLDVPVPAQKEGGAFDFSAPDSEGEGDE